MPQWKFFFSPIVSLKLVSNAGESLAWNSFGHIGELFVKSCGKKVISLARLVVDFKTLKVHFMNLLKTFYRWAWRWFSYSLHKEDSLQFNPFICLCFYGQRSPRWPPWPHNNGSNELLSCRARSYSSSFPNNTSVLFTISLRYACFISMEKN